MFSKLSLQRLSTCHPDLQRLFNEVVKETDCTILEGHRDEAAQNAAFASGASQKQWPDGEHNKLPSRAVDAAPYPLDWNDTGSFYIFAGIVKATARRLGIKIRCGADWNGDGKTKDQKFNDLPHFELAD